MDQWLLAMASDPAAKGLAKDLEVASAGLVHCHFSLLSSFFVMCSSKRCLSAKIKLTIFAPFCTFEQLNKSL